MDCTTCKCCVDIYIIINDFSFIQNTYTNATKLLTAAQELAHTGECAADEIYAVAQELEAHVSSFAARVEQRRRRLDLAVVFYTHEKEVQYKINTSSGKNIETGVYTFNS